MKPVDPDAGFAYMTGVWAVTLSISDRRFRVSLAGVSLSGRDLACGRRKTGEVVVGRSEIDQGALADGDPTDLRLADQRADRGLSQPIASARLGIRAIQCGGIRLPTALSISSFERHSRQSSWFNEAERGRECRRGSGSLQEKVVAYLYGRVTLEIGNHVFWRNAGVGGK